MQISFFNKNKEQTLNFFEVEEYEKEEARKFNLIKDALNKASSELKIKFVQIKNNEDKNKFPWRE